MLAAESSQKSGDLRSAYDRMDLPMLGVVMNRLKQRAAEEEEGKSIAKHMDLSLTNKHISCNS